MQTLCKDNQDISSIQGTDNALSSDKIYEDGSDGYMCLFEHHVSTLCGLHAISNGAGFELLQAASMNITCTEYLREMLREGTFEHPDMHISPCGKHSEVDGFCSPASYQHA